MGAVGMRSHVPPRPFWPGQLRNLDKGWRLEWDRLVERLWQSDPLTLYRAVEEGVPTAAVLLLSKALGESASQLLMLLGIPETTFRRKSEAGEVLPEVAAHRVVALMRVVAKLRQLLAESGDAERMKQFDLESWVGAWIREPLAELGGETPAALLRNPQGQRVIEDLLERMRGGLVA